MLDELLETKEVKDLLDKIINNKNYNKSNKVKDLEFLDINNSLFLVYESIYKFYIILNDKTLFEDYMNKVSRLILKLDTYNEISYAINKLIGSIIKNKLNISNNKDILNYIYDKYVINGYLFLGINSKILSDILNDGINVNTINKYTNTELSNLLSKYDIEIKGGNVTDNFISGCFDAYTFPHYLYRVTNNHLTMTSKYNKDAYFNKNLEISLKNLNKLIKEVNINKKDSSKIIEIYNQDFNNYIKNDYSPKLIMIRRNLLEKDNFISINKILENNDSLENNIARIIDYKYNNIVIDQYINFEDLLTINLIKINNLIKEKEEVPLINQKGAISLMFIVGILLILTGIILFILNL